MMQTLQPHTRNKKEQKENQPKLPKLQCPTTKILSSIWKLVVFSHHLGAILIHQDIHLDVPSRKICFLKNVLVT
jgi:hypothetical protein